MIPEFLPTLCKLSVLLCCQALHTVKGSQPNFAKGEEVNGADASRVRWRRIVNVYETIDIRSLVSRGPKTFKVSNGIASGGLQWQCIANFHIF